MSNCKHCGAESVYREGVTKGKPWTAYFCQDKTNKCPPEWVKTKKMPHPGQVAQPQFPSLSEAVFGKSDAEKTAPQPTPPVVVKKKNEARISALAIVKSLIESGFYESYKGDPETMKEKIYDDVTYYENRWM